MAAFASAQESVPVPGTASAITARPKAGPSSHLDGEGTLLLAPGKLGEVVAEVEKLVPQMQAHGQGSWAMPNLIFGSGTEQAVVPTALRLRQVSPLQAVTLAGAAAGCALESVTSPAVELAPAAPGTSSDGGQPPVIGYRFVLTQQAAPASQPEPKKLRVLTTRVAGAPGEEIPGMGMGGIGITLSAKDGHLLVNDVLPGLPAARSREVKEGDRLYSIIEDGGPDVDLTKLSPSEAAEKLRGRPGSSVVLKLRDAPDGAVRQVTLMREPLGVPLPPPGLPAGSSFIVREPLTGNVMIREIGAPVPHFTMKLDGPPGIPVPPPMVAAPQTTPPPPGTAVLPSVRIYSFGAILKGSSSDDNEAAKQYKMAVRSIEDLVGQAMEKAGLAATAPELSFHAATKALIVKASAAQHEIIQQIITVLKENQAENPSNQRP